MNRSIYQTVNRSIRDNGFRYTLQHAIDIGDTDSILTIDEIVNVTKQTDWLAMRARFARMEKPAIAFKLTSPFYCTRHDVEVSIWGKH